MFDDPVDVRSLAALDAAAKDSGSLIVERPIEEQSSIADRSTDAIDRGQLADTHISLFDDRDSRTPVRDSRTPDPIVTPVTNRDSRTPDRRSQSQIDDRSPATYVRDNEMRHHSVDDRLSTPKAKGSSDERSANVSPARSRSPDRNARSPGRNARSPGRNARSPRSGHCLRERCE